MRPVVPPTADLEASFDDLLAGSGGEDNVSMGSSPGIAGRSSVSSVASNDVEVVGYPRSRACVNHLYLPRYRARETLKQRLIEAMVSSVHHDEITS
jgi:hypothetical protein